MTARESCVAPARRAFSMAAVTLACCAGSASAAERDLPDLSLEELGNIVVTSVSRREERLSDAAASIFVITSEDIRRSGVRSLPEALRLAPNLQVARNNASQYSISARGFNNTIGNKLLVLIDGRTVYTPLFSGVFWDQQVVMLEDIERIEVISGPGATLWGANAVNGVINVITRTAEKTQGTLASIGAGNRETGAALRYGGKIGSEGHYRVYGKWLDADNTTTARGASAADQWKHGQVGFRMDWNGVTDGYTLQGDAYSGRSQDRGSVGAIALGRVEVSGVNLLGRWNRRFSDGSDIRVQAYLDHSERDDVILFRPNSNIFDIEFQHAIPKGAHKILWGGGYRHARDNVAPGLIVTFIPMRSQLDWLNVFVQDEIALTRNLQLTAGLKLERNDYSGWEYLPSLRLAWKPLDNRLVWGAFSRAVRAPSRLDRDVFAPPNPPFFVRGGPNFESEVANVFELGYRAQPTKALTYSITAFHHIWDKLRSGEVVGGAVVLENKIEGKMSGIEAWATYQVTRAWRLSGGLSTLSEHLRLKQGSTDPVGARNTNLANDPDHWWSLRSSLNLTAKHDFDVMVRRVGALSQPTVPGYTAVDARLGWRPSRAVEVSLTVQNLFDPAHAEFGSAASRSEYGRSVFLNVLFRQ